MIIRHIGITVKDLEKSIYFYKNLLGFSIAREMNESGNFIDSISGLKNVKVRTVKLNSPSKDGGMIELLCYSSHDSNISKDEITKCGISHFALTVDNIASVYEKLKSNGIVFNCEPKMSDDGGAIVTFCRDYDNNLIEIVEVQ